MAKLDKITAEELASCRNELERRWKSQIVDDKLLERAWQVAYDIATILYDEFGASEVAVFGSLSHPIGFTNSSDIDIAVWGLSDNEHTKANWKVKDIDTGFKIDLINFDTSKGLFRERVQQQAIPIKNGEQPMSWKSLYEHIHRQGFPIVEEEIYEMNRQKLTQRIADELAKIEDTLSRIRRGIESINVLPIQAREFIENTIATDLADIYSGVERIFERIAREVDGHLPRGSQWHKDLLQQMTQQRPERSPVISENTSLQLQELLAFRHKVNNIYGTELKYDNTFEHAATIDELFTNVSQDLNTFTDSLAQAQD